LILKKCRITGSATNLFLTKQHAYYARQISAKGISTV